MSIQDDHDLSDDEVSHIIGMAWKDDVPFEAIEARYNLDEDAVIALMRNHLKRSSWELWRKRVSGRPTKHAARRSLTDTVSRRPPGGRSAGASDAEPLPDSLDRSSLPARLGDLERFPDESWYRFQIMMSDYLQACSTGKTEVIFL